MNRVEVRLSGFGGQGIILAAHILGQAAALHDNKHATMTQNYGPESRGGACSGQVVISDMPVSYPHLTHPNVVVAMSQEAYGKYAADLAAGGVVLIDEDLVKPVPAPQGQLFSVPATRIAEQELGRKMTANTVMLGFFAAMDRTVSADALRASVRDSVPQGSEALNLKAFESGFSYGQALLAGKKGNTQ